MKAVITRLADELARRRIETLEHQLAERTWERDEARREAADLRWRLCWRLERR